MGLIGLGYVGLPLVRAIADAGFATLGFDIDRTKIDALNAGRSYIRYITDRDIAALRAGGRFEATTDFVRVAELDVILICVPTPLSRHREPALSFVERTAQSLAPHLRAGQLVILESTSYPGTTGEVLRPLLERFLMHKDKSPDRNGVPILMLTFTSCYSSVPMHALSAASKAAGHAKGAAVALTPLTTGSEPVAPWPG